MDTDFLIDLNRGRHNPWRRRAEKLLLEMDEELYISTVTVVEFLTGLAKDKQEEARRMLQELYLYLSPSYEEAVLAGKLRQEWLRRGVTLSLADVTNAAIAISRNLVLVTRNTAHYPFEGLIIKSW